MNLVKCGEYIIRELDFCNGCMPHGCEANSKACDALFGQWGIEDPLATCNAIG
jgi:hypothetical protein